MKSFRRWQAVCAAALLTLLLCDALALSPRYAVKAATERVGESGFNPTAFTNLVQLTEAVLAPAWGTGGYAYTMNGMNVNRTSSLRPVCVHTRASPSLVAAPFTFSMFDAQFSPLYSVAAGITSANAIGQLDLQKCCYISLADVAPAPPFYSGTSKDACTAAFVSQDAQCAFGSEDALAHNLTADALISGTSTAEELAQTTMSLPASGLSASELFALFLNDYLPQRAWLRTAVPRSLDLLYTAMQAARVFHSSTASLVDADETADMQRAIASEWNTYLWSVYGPQLRRKWDLFYRFATATLTKGGIAPSLKLSASRSKWENSITGISSPARVTTCPLVDGWLPLRYSPEDVNVARLAQFMEAALKGLTDALAAIRRSSNKSTRVAQSDDLLFHLIRSAYCVTITNLFSLIALLDRPFLQAISSVWLDAANHSDSWAWQTMRAASVTGAVHNASAFQSLVATQVRALSSSLSAASEKSFVSCLTVFLDPTTPLTSATVVSPSDCVRQFLETREASVSLSESFTVLFELGKLSAASSASSVPGITRYESVVHLPSGGGSATTPLKWFMVQESELPLTAQTSVVTPTPPSPPHRDPCTAKTQSLALARDWGLPEECAEGTYLVEGSTACATCPSACAALWSGLRSTAVPVYCPGDGLLHACPPRPADAVYAGSTSGGQRGPYAVCRYACTSAYAAPMNYSCLSVSGMYYDTYATGNADIYNGGGLLRCAGPASLFPTSSPARSQTRLYTFVGSGTTNAPLSCPFTLLHRATSSAVTLKALEATGLAPPPPFFQIGTSVASAPASTSPVSSSFLVSRSGVTWEVEVQLNATQMYAMHAALRQSLKKQSREVSAGADGTAVATSSTIAHELVAWQKITADRSMSSAGEAERVLAWYLVSTLHYAANGSSSSSNCNAHFSLGCGATVSLQLLLNLSISTSPSPPSLVSTSSTHAASTNATNPAPASLIVLSSAWSWSPSSSHVASSPMSTSTYRAVFNRQTNTVAFFVDGSKAPLSAAPVTVDWPLWTPTATAKATASPTSSLAMELRESSFFLSVGGWVAGYTEARQWLLFTQAATNPGSHTTSGSATLPLYYDYLPGMVTRLSSAASLIHAFQGTLQAAESSWKEQAAAKAPAQGQHVAQLTSLTDLAHYVSATPAVASSVSGALNALALLATKGLDGVCRPSYGVLPTSRSDSACELCMKGGYTVMRVVAAAAGKNRCACIPQRIAAISTEAFTRRQVSVCQARKGGPAMPRSSLTAAATLYVDGDTVDRENATAARIPLGWYVAAAGNAFAVPTTSLVTSVTCALGLTYPATKMTSTAAPFNTSVFLQYATGLGGEMCEARAAAYGGAPSAVHGKSSMTKPTYTGTRLYSTRLRAPALSTAVITLKNNSALFADQTVLTVGVRNYALLPFYAMHSLLQMEQLTEYQLSFLAYALRSATVSAKLDCGGDQREGSAARDFQWASESALDTSVLWLNITEAITHDCTLTLRVTSAASAASESGVPLPSWPHSYLRVPPSIPPSSFFESSPTLMYVVRAPSTAFTPVSKHSVLSEMNSFLISACMAVLSVILGACRAFSHHPPSLDLLPWRRYEQMIEAEAHEELYSW
ncbi:hypothetical protein ABL78_1161 [Leptomonas seymouri]|uniref:Uncharacterized protein n=1 Tax=Leptomonas seymouri TaxID=5684 RepID=A0A0N1I147_LEPSE|nr:hypothetical protein ABL78_1161 [Leptomonas seymouri]|eukprot:KPI89781.1 hypothetical protein ABL78_1161 [Leptomonas seymouri]